MDTVQEEFVIVYLDTMVPIVQKQLVHLLKFTIKLLLLALLLVLVEHITTNIHLHACHVIQAVSNVETSQQYVQAVLQLRQIQCIFTLRIALVSQFVLVTLLQMEISVGIAIRLLLFVVLVSIVSQTVHHALVVNSCRIHSSVAV
jgi:inner membrane protein involved in colicin E2 resistance